MRTPGQSTAGRTPARPAAVGDAALSVARLVALDPGLYAFSLAEDTRWREPDVGFAVPAVHVAAAPAHDGLEITDASGGSGTWLGGRRKILFVKAPRGGTALVTAYLPRDPAEKPLELEIRRLGDGNSLPGAAGRIADPPPPIARLRLGGPVAIDAPAGQPVGMEIVAHIRNRGDLRFTETGWVGRLGTGNWIESFVIAPLDRQAAAAIECKGLMANGGETPWVPCGTPCGTRGRGMPLLGFAIRQKALPGGALYDCEYSGSFQSGETAGPCRNGAPCRSPNDNDPLEGILLRITPRQAAPPPAEPVPTRSGRRTAAPPA